jgi:hypothetical protein
MKLTLGSVLFFFGLVCSITKAQSGQLVPTDRFTGVIFSAKDYGSKDMLQTLGSALGENVVGVWTPTNEDVLTLETAFITYLNEPRNARAKEVLTKLHAYKRQYIGVELEDQDLVFATFDACTDLSDDELIKELIPFLPLDGGICFIELLFDPKTQTFYRVYIHGEA